MKKILAGLAATMAGAIIGVILAREITLWIGFSAVTQFVGLVVGAIFGGFTAWSGSDVEHFLAGIRRAWKEIIAPSYQYLLKEPNWERGKEAGVEMFLGLSAFSLFGLLYTVVVGMDMFYTAEIHWSTVLLVFEFSLATTVFCAFVAGMLSLVAVFDLEELTEREKENYRELRLGLVVFNPVIIMLGGLFIGVLILPALVVGTLLLAVVSFRKGYRLGRDFVLRSYQYVHTYRRRCAFIGAVGGTIIGVVCGYNVAVAALTGASLFILEYEFFGKRVMKKVPA